MKAKKLKVTFPSGPVYLDKWDITRKNDDGSIEIEWFGRKTITPDQFEVITYEQFLEETRK